MGDALQRGQRFRTLNVIDDHRRSCLGIFVEYAFPSTRVTDYLDIIGNSVGYPQHIRLDHGLPFESSVFS